MIFVAIAAYRDPELFHTIWNARARAARIDDIVFGVVEQAHRSETLDDLGPGVRRVLIRPEDSRGLGFARSLCFSLYRGEDYLLQVDSHTVFEQDWDARLVAALEALPGKAIISSFPMPYTLDNGVRRIYPNPAMQVMAVKDGQALTPDDPQLVFRGVAVDGPAPVPGIHLAGGFVFTRGAFVEDVPYDPFLYFRDEQAMMIRAWTRGWDVWHMRDVPLYHLYRDTGPETRRLHWHDHEGHPEEQRAKARLRRLFYERGNGMGVFGLGCERTLEDFARFSGIDYPRRQLDV